MNARQRKTAGQIRRLQRGLDKRFGIKRPRRRLWGTSLWEGEPTSISLPGTLPMRPPDHQDAMFISPILGMREKSLDNSLLHDAKSKNSEMFCLIREPEVLLQPRSLSTDRVKTYMRVLHLTPSLISVEACLITLSQKEDWRKDDSTTNGSQGIILALLYIVVQSQDSPPALSPMRSPCLAARLSSRVSHSFA